MVTPRALERPARGGPELKKKKTKNSQWPPKTPQIKSRG